MKSILLVRHAKSSWDNIELGDLERPLKPRGIKDSSTISQQLASEKPSVDILICSPAVRAFETAKIFADTLQIKGSQFKVDERLYLPTFPDLFKFVLYLDNDLNTVMLVGHEPSLSTFINEFVDHSLDRVRTSSVTQIDFDVKSWSEISKSSVKRMHHRNRHDVVGKIVQ